MNRHTLKGPTWPSPTLSLRLKARRLCKNFFDTSTFQTFLTLQCLNTTHEEFPFLWFRIRTQHTSWCRVHFLVLIRHILFQLLANKSWFEKHCDQEAVESRIQAAIIASQQRLRRVVKKFVVWALAISLSVIISAGIPVIQKDYLPLHVCQRRRSF